MTVKKYRKKPIVIRAIQWTGDNATEVLAFIDPNGKEASGGLLDGILSIATLEGIMRADHGDWIIRGLKGEFYPCKADIFEASYDEEIVVRGGR